MGQVTRDPVSRWVRADGVVSHYLDAGEGPPVLLLHGGEFGAGAEVTWDRCIPELARDRRVIALDLLGFGRTDKVRDLVDQRGRMVRQVAAVLDVLCLDQVDVVGTSLSGRLLLDVVASDRPAWPVRSAGVVGLGLHPPSLEVRTALGSFDGTPASMAPTLQLLFADPEVATDPEVLARRMALAHLPGAWQSGRASTLGRPAGTPRRPRPTPTDLSRITVPTLLIRGGADAIVPREDFDALVAALPAARACEVGGAGHYPQVERPGEVTALLRGFLAEVDSTQEASHG